MSRWFRVLQVALGLSAYIIFMSIDRYDKPFVIDKIGVTAPEDDPYYILQPSESPIRGDSQSANENDGYIYSPEGIDSALIKDDIPNFYKDKYETYDCSGRLNYAGSHPKFMVLGVHKGGSTALYSYLAKHGRIRPAICKEIHFFDDDSQFAKGKTFYLRHFPDVSMWKSKVITGEGSPDYIRMPQVPKRVKSLFPDCKFLVTLREPSTRFESHWIGKKDQRIPPMSLMTCEQAWNASFKEVDACLKEESFEDCEKKLHENAAVRGVYLPQIQQWLKFFPPEQFMIIQAEHMFIDVNAVMQKVARFLNIRPYTVEELASLKDADKGSAHISEPLVDQCREVKPRMDAFFADPNRRLRKFLNETYPPVVEDWVEGWSGWDD